jgi:hypothetical protein
MAPSRDGLLSVVVKAHGVRYQHPIRMRRIRDADLFTLACASRSDRKRVERLACKKGRFDGAPLPYIQAAQPSIDSEITNRLLLTGTACVAELPGVDVTKRCGVYVDR